MKGRSKPIAQAIVYSFASYISYILMLAAWAFVKDERDYESMLFENVPAWYFEIIIPIGFGLMFCRFGLLVIERIIQAYTYKGEEVA